MAVSDAQGVPKPPPNLRVSTDETQECDSCTHYQRGRCALPAPYDANLPVDAEWVCDSYKQGRQDDDPPAPGSGAKTVQEAYDQRVQVRAHSRRRNT